MPRGQTFISLGKEYEVQALVVFDGQAYVQIVDDIRHIGWYSAWFFDAVDPSISTDWICTISDTRVQMIMGPPFIARSEEEYSRMVELDPDLVELFWTRFNSHLR
jgi:hypothetical protein